MAMTISKEARKMFMKYVKNAQSTQSVKLFKNNVTISADTVYEDLTLATQTALAPQTPSWGSISLDGSNRATMSATTLTFTCDGTQSSEDIYGYALVDSNSGTPQLLAIDNVPSPPKTMANNGDAIAVTLTLTDTQA